MKTLSQINAELAALNEHMSPLQSKKSDLEREHFEAVKEAAGNADWKPSSDAPDGVEVLTKIYDGKGVRNVCALKRQRNLWFYPDGSMYVYYTPTHFAYIC